MEVSNTNPFHSPSGGTTTTEPVAYSTEATATVNAHTIKTCSETVATEGLKWGAGINDDTKIKLKNLNTAIPPVYQKEEGQPFQFGRRRPQCRHMADEVSRLKSFTDKWQPQENIDPSVTPEALARAGFYFYQAPDKVKCWQCNLGLKDWDEDSNPLIDHAQHASYCEYIFDTFGEEYHGQTRLKHSQIRIPSLDLLNNTTDIDLQPRTFQQALLSQLEQMAQVKRTDSQAIIDLSISGKPFFELANAFLQIPVTEFLPLDDDCIDALKSAYQQHSLEVKNSPSAHIIKLKILLNRLLLDWQQGKNDKKTVLKKLTTLEELANKDGWSLSVFLENLLYLHQYKNILDNNGGSPEKCQPLREALFNPAFPDEYNIKNINWQMLDLYPLQALIHFDALPSIEGFPNYAKGSQLLGAFSTVLKSHLTFMTPVCFTPYDYLRLAPSTPGHLPIILNKATKLHYTKFYMNMAIVQYLNHVFGGLRGSDTALQITESLSKHPLSEFNHFLFYDVRFGLTDTVERTIKYTLLKTAIGKKEYQLAINVIDQKLQLSETRKGTFRSEPYGIYSHQKAMILLSQAGYESHRKQYSKVASVFKQSAQYVPHHFHHAYTYFCKAGMTLSAVSTAKQYAAYWQDKNQVLAEYWNDLTDRLQQTHSSTLKISAPNNKAHKNSETYDIDALLKSFEDDNECTITIPKNKLKKQKQQKRNKPAITSQTLLHLETTKKHQHASSLSTNHGKSRPKKIPLVHVTPGGANRQDITFSEDGFMIATAKGAIEPQKRLFQRYWNPMVKRILAAVRAAREEGNYEKEIKVYNRVLKNPKFRSMIGIERIWEEQAWTKLHLLHNIFAVDALPSSLKPQAREWLDIAHKQCILPWIAYTLGQEEITADIRPEAIWKATNELLEQLPNNLRKEEVDEFCFRARCFFSTWGHYFSILSMLTPEHAAVLRKKAQMCYGYKTIDPNFSRMPST